MSYAVFTMFKTAPDFRDEAISIINQLKEITLANGAAGARIGTVSYTHLTLPTIPQV